MRLFYETSCLSSKSCSASVHFCPLLWEGFIFSYFSPAGEGLCLCSFSSKMLEWTCHSSESLLGSSCLSLGRSRECQCQIALQLLLFRSLLDQDGWRELCWEKKKDASISPSLQLTHSARLDPWVVVPNSFHTLLSQWTGPTYFCFINISFGQAELCWITIWWCWSTKCFQTNTY